MKTVTEILGGAQGLLGITFDLQSCFEEMLNDQQKTFLQMLRCMELHLPPLLCTGRTQEPEGSHTNTCRFCEANGLRAIFRLPQQQCS